MLRGTELGVMGLGLKFGVEGPSIKEYFSVHYPQGGQ